jgi:deoxyribonuclease-4
LLRLDQGIDPLFLHAVYLINLASDDERIYDASIRSLSWSLGCSDHLGAAGVVVHVGSHTGRGFEAVRSRIASALARVLENRPPERQLILENSAGGGGSIGADFEEMKAIVGDLGNPPNLGICIDTAHAFASGYDLRLDSGAEKLLGEVDAGPGLDRLRVLHLNDSRTDVGSHSDRHENIGAGQIGLQGFANLLSRPEIAGLPLVLETPNPEKRPADLTAVRAVCSAPVAPPLDPD